MLRQLQALQERADQLSALARGLSRSAPERADGSDATGWVKVVLDGTGLPVEIQVRNGWEQRVESDRLAARIIEAHADAINQGMRAWSQSLDDNRWHFQRNIFTSGEGSTDSGEQPRVPAGERREVSELAEVVISRLQSAQQETLPGPSAVEGRDDGRHVTIRLESGGTASCSIDPQWVVRRSGDVITSALMTALRRARAKLATENKSTVGVDGLVGDVLATLESLENL